MFSPMDKQIIDACTVQVRREVVGKIVCYYCSHADLEMLEIGTDNIYNRTHKALQPVVSVPQYCIGKWNSTVSFYGKVEDVPALFVPMESMIAAL